MLGSYGEIIQGCDDLNRTSYLRSEGMRIQELPRSTIRAVSLNQCAKHCSSKNNAVDCHSFEYNAASQICSLQSVQGQPFGPSIVANTNEPGISFFQQICIASEELCAAPYAFERFPQHVLVDQALETFSADGLSECLSLCLEAKRKLKLDCRSLMFYYETGECILNRETKKDLPKKFTNDTKFQLVDYFENNCYDVTCFGSSDIHWIRAEDFNIGIEKDVIMNGLTIDECKQACIENMVGAEMFPCKAFVYSTAKQECHLTAESGLTRKMSTSITTDDDTTSNRLNAELSAINAGQYYEKYCIEGPTKCKETSFEVIPDRMINNECVLNKKSQYSDPEIFVPAINVDYFDNICEYLPNSLPTTIGEAPRNVFSLDTESVQTDDKSIEEALYTFKEADDKNQSETRLKPVFQPLREPIEKVKGTLATECRLDGIIITAHFEEPTSGALFIKDHSSTCRKVFNNIVESQLEIPFPSSVDSNPDCPGIELAPNLWSFIVVIQKNNIGIPSLMTESDRIFNVTCDYSNTAVSASKLDSNQQSEVFVTSKTNEEFIGKIKMAILRDGKPVTTVSLGEELELKWNIENFKNDEKKQKLHCSDKLSTAAYQIAYRYNNVLDVINE
uniref:PAN domain protein n=1 Tax=Panagrolaimus superbus TaxID=310955 RepID=A0A914YZB3_9BILA